MHALGPSLFLDPEIALLAILPPHEFEEGSALMLACGSCYLVWMT